MSDLQIIEQLLKGQHLSDAEIKKAKTILNKLNAELETRKN